MTSVTSVVGDGVDASRPLPPSLPDAAATAAAVEQRRHQIAKPYSGCRSIHSAPQASPFGDDDGVADVAAAAADAADVADDRLLALEH